MFCSHCGKKVEFLSMRALCDKCQRIKGAIGNRTFNWKTGKKN